MKTNLIRLEETTTKGALKLLSLNAREALEYVKRWSLDLDSGVFVSTMDEAYTAARDLLDGVSHLEYVDISAVDVKKVAAYITYPRVGNFTVHGLLLRLPTAPSHFFDIVRACTYED